MSAVSRSRISPTMITSGSWRTMCRRPAENVSPICVFTWIWLIPSIWYSTGSSMVMIFLSGWLMRLSAEKSVVDLPLPVGPVTRKMPCGKRGEMLHAGQHVVVEAQLLKIVEVARRPVQEAHDHALSVERGKRGNAQIDLAAQDLDLDAPVLRQAPLGDVELRHQLHARDDRRFQFAQRRLLAVQDAVHAVANRGIPSRTARCGCRWRASPRPGRSWRSPAG